jgi:hypothetical protein
VLALDLEADPVTDLRAERRAARERAEAEAHAAKLAATLRASMGAYVPDVELVETTVNGVAEAKAARLAREAEQAKRATKPQRVVLSRRRQYEPAQPGALPQTASPPPHIRPNPQREAEAARVAHVSALKAGRRELVHLPAWSRELSGRIATSRSAATRELCHVPRAIADSLRASARPFGELDTCAGRNVVALGVVFYWLGKALRGRLSGLSSEAWASLTVGAHGKHYSSSALFHAHHRHNEAELDPKLRGLYGGRIGTGRNVGLVRAIETEGWLRVIVPDGALVPGWMVAPSGWAFVQVLVSDGGPTEDSS